MTALRGSTYWTTSFPWNVPNVWFITSRFDCIYYEPQAFVCKPRAFVHFICGCKEKILI